MDVEKKEMQFLGFLGILRESFKIINIRRKIFGQIALSLILPSTFITLSQIEVTDFLIRKIKYNEIVLHLTQTGTASYNKISDLVTSEWTYLLFFNLVCLIFLVILSLLSTSAVVYTIACIYTSREVTFKKVMTVVPKVWKRLMITFLCLVLFYFLYNLVAVFVFAIIMALVTLSNNNSTGPVIAVIVLLCCVYLVGLAYMKIIWQLGFVISVLEDIRGTKALQKSRNLLKGKMVVANIIFITMNFLAAMIGFAFQLFLQGGRLGMVTRLAYGTICLLLIFMVSLLGRVIETVLYFVCKSYHHENIDKLALSDHLEVYSGAYAPVKSKDGQLEEFQV